MSPDDPRHGTHAGAVAHWRDKETPCTPCLDASRRQNKSAELDRLRGNPRLTRLGEEAHAIIASRTRTQLSAATGITPHKLSNLHAAGPDKQVNRHTRDRILIAGRDSHWTAIGIQRRLRALQALGWSMAALSAETGLPSTSLIKLLWREAPQFVRSEFAGQIMTTYERLCMTPRHGRGATRARNQAKIRGWLPPLAWDDIDHDDGPLPVAYIAPDRAEALRDMRDTGKGASDVIRRLGVSEEALEKWCARNDMRDLWRELVARDGERNRNQHTEDVA